MSNIVEATPFINFISEYKKIFVTSSGAPISQMFKIDSQIDDFYYFKIINSRNQTVSLHNRSFEIYGSYIDAKSKQHILFHNSSYAIEDNVLIFRINTYTDKYLEYVTTQKTINITIVETTTPITQVVLRDNALAYPRPYIDGKDPQQIVEYETLTGLTVPVSGSFAAGTDISLVPEVLTYAFGKGLITNNANQLVVGSYNVPDADQVFVVANGNNNHRRNLFTVNRYGQAYLSGVRVLTANDRTNVSQLANDIGYITIADVPVYHAGTGLALNGKTFSLTASIPSSVEELSDGSNYALKTYVDSSVETASATVTSWVNDQGYLTAHQDLSNYATTDQLNEVSATIPTNYLSSVNGLGQVIVQYTQTPHEMIISLGDNVAYKTDGYITGYNAGSGISIVDGTINCTVEGGGGATYTAGEGIGITNNVISLTATIPTVPTNVGAFTNDVGYLSSLVINIDGTDETQMTSLYLDNNFYIYEGMIGLDATNIWQSMYDSGLFVDYALTSDIPLSTSQLTNDSDFITSSALTGITPSKLKNIVVDDTVRSSYQKLQYNPSADLIVNTIKVNNSTDEILILNSVSGFENDIPVGKAVQFDQWVKVFGRFNKVQLGNGLINAGGPLLDENYYSSNYFASQGNIQNYTRSIVRLDANTTLQTIKYNGWFVGNPHASDPLTFKSTGTTAIKLVLNGSYANTPDFRYSFDLSQGWIWYNIDNPQWIVLNDGDELRFANATEYFSHSSSDYYQFETSGAGSLEIYGNIRSMNNYSQWTMSNNMFYKMFAGCEQITNATNLSIPTYSQIGSETYIYASMFSGCINLVYGPSELPRPRYLSPNACDSMFYGCSSLISAPPVVGKNENGSAGLFNNMFYGCSSLSSITAEFTEWGDSINWVDGVAANGTFIKTSDLSDSRGSNAIPDNWTIVNV